MPRLRLLLTALAVALAAPCLAHNGAAGVMLPVSGITVDGDLSDWPDHLPWYPILLPTTGEVARDSTDLSARFRMGHKVDENALYFAIEVEDESTVIDTSAAGRFEAQDGCDLFINVKHAEVDSTSQWQGLHQYVLWGQTRRVFKEGKPADVQSAYNRRGRTGHRYEWRVDLAELSEGTFELSTDSVIGLEVADFDLDEDGSLTYQTWGALRFSPDSYPYRGDAVILADRSQAASLHGTVGWNVEGMEGPAHLRLRDLDRPVRIDAVSDETGNYEVEMPAKRVLWKWNWHKTWTVSLWREG